MKRITLLILVTLLTHKALAITTTQENNQLLNDSTKASLIADYDYFMEQLEAIHPDPDGMGVSLINDSVRNRIIDGYICLDKALLYQQHGNPVYRPKHIYVVTNQSTFSAAFHYAFMLWRMGATVVGVPSSQAPNTFMETTEFVLPNTGIPCSVSNSIQRFLPDDDPRAHVFWPDWMPSYNDYEHYNFDMQSDLLYVLDHLDYAN